MKTAREMFEELGYTFHDDSCFDELEFRKDVEPEIIISFDLSSKTVAVYDWGDYSDGFGTHYMSMQELQAINQMCKELGWFDE